MTAGNETPILDVRDLRVAGADGSFAIVEDVSFTVAAGRRLGIVGESGSGKTTVAMALLGFAQRGTVIAGGEIHVGGVDLVALDERGRRAHRGRDIAYVPQDPATGLSPGMRIGRALREMVNSHLPGLDDVDARVGQVLREAQLPDGDAFQARYPHQLSGGQQQRVAIALALICRPRAIVMDEPTTGLDVTTQARLLDVINKIVDDHGIALVYVTHDLAAARNLVDDVAVMYGGRIVERGPVDDIFVSPRHPYTRRLLEAVPRVAATTFRPRGIPGIAVEPWDWPEGCPFTVRCEHATESCHESMPPIQAPSAGRIVRCFNWTDLEPTAPRSQRVAVAEAQRPVVAENVPLLQVCNLTAGYGPTVAVSDISFSVEAGTCAAIVGESGSGKSTTLRSIAGLHQPTAGEILLNGVELAGRARARAQSTRRRLQLVPQNPDSSLNPHRTVEEILARPLRQFFGLRGREQRARARGLLDLVQLPTGMASRYPKELSGGQRQRVAIARALAVEPELLLCDEIVAALDVAVQASILALLDQLRRDLGTTIVFVSHDLAVVRSISDTVVVMASGHVREVGPIGGIFETPEHEYTKALLGAVPDMRPTDYPAAHAP